MARVFGETAVVETHISRVLLTPDRAYKLLKPVRTPFFDFEATSTRLAAAQKEFELNHRLAPDVYLGTGDVIENGEIADRMIVMRRLPTARQLDHLVGQSNFSDADLQGNVRQVARLMATIHSRETPLFGASAWMATKDAVARRWAENREALDPVVGTILDADEVARVDAMAAAFHTSCEKLFEKRIADGLIRDGHGDLRAEHVFCLDEGPRVIDCLAFRDDYRIGDVLADIGFLAMDLHRLAGPGAAVGLLDAYKEFTNEVHPSSLAHHYVAYRAHVRAKVACIRFGQGDTEAAAETQMYHRLAEHHLTHGQVRLVIVGGGAGVGKTTVASGLADRLRGTWLRTDEIRKNLAGMSQDDHAFAEPDQGIYTREATDQAYATMLHQAEALIAHGESVVLDATWSNAEHRAQVMKMASRMSVPVVELECVLPAHLAKERIARRLASTHNPSDATPAVADHIASTFAPWPTSAKISTNQPVAGAVTDAAAAVFQCR